MKKLFLNILLAVLVVALIGTTFVLQDTVSAQSRQMKMMDAIAGGTLAPGNVDKYVMPLVKPPAMPGKVNKNKDKYKIAVRQFTQQILPPGNPVTTVWSYGPENDVNADGSARTVAQGGSYFYPAFTIEARANKTTQVHWSNRLVDAGGNPLPHLLPVDPSLHWANPIGMRDTRPSPADTAYWNHPYLQGPDHNYVGPVPMIVHVHGAHTLEDSDGYPEAWYLPVEAAQDPNINYTAGTFFDYMNNKYNNGWVPGKVSFKYPNDQPATTLWYHDHTLGMTRLNVYAGPAGFWLIRGGPNDVDLGYVAPGVGDDPFGEYTEIPIAIQDRSFNTDGSLFYPDNRAFFEGLDPTQLQIPFIPDTACEGLDSDISAIWVPEFFGNMMVVNGQTWPYLNVQQTRYRFRLLNGCNSRFLILRMDNNQSFFQIGGDQGFLPAPVELQQLLMAPAERADVIVDFSNVPVGTEIILTNLGPDEPYGGGIPGVDFDLADPDSTGQVMLFRVTGPTGPPPTLGSLPATLPAAPLPGPATSTRQISLNEEESRTVRVVEDGSGNIVLACADTAAEAFGPSAALLGTLAPNPDNHDALGRLWMQPITENPAVGSTEIWEIYNFTADAHPIHIHLIHFEVVNRQALNGSLPTLPVRGPEIWEAGGYKDTVIAYPGEVTRVKAFYDVPGLYVWHCHIVEHEDNEMMRPYHIGPIPADNPVGPPAAGAAAASIIKK